MTDEVMQHLALLARTIADRPPGPEPDDVLLERILAEHPHPRRAPRWKPVIAGVSAVVVLGTGAVAAAVIRSERVQAPTSLVCRAAASRTASAIVLPMSDDPIGECARLWLDGRLPDLDEPGDGGARPDLIACTAPDRALEVLPAFADETCEMLGLTPADVPAAVADPLVELDRRVVEMNKACISVSDARQQAPALLEELGFDDWSVSVIDRDDPCGRIAIDTEAKQLVVFPSPPDAGG
jgi:hypothetical protein